MGTFLFLGFDIIVYLYWLLTNIHSYHGTIILKYVYNMLYKFYYYLILKKKKKVLLLFLLNFENVT